VPDSENGNVRVYVRRRRTRHHRSRRRMRLIRRALAVSAVLFLTVGLSALALKYFSPSLFRAKQSSSPVLERADLSRSSVALDQIVSEAKSARPVYPYSIVPGGVENAKELKWVAEHDPVVAAHYAGFDYERAQVVRVTLARTVYLSYRIGNHVYWTRRRIALHKGEKLITDGKMTARARCANRIEEQPQQEAASPVEPSPEKFDEPVRAGSGTAMQGPPVAFESALLGRPAPGLGPAAPLSVYDPLVGGSFLTISPPPLPAGLCSPFKKKNSTGGIEIDDTNPRKKKVNPCASAGGGTPATVPEPGTWLLFASGLAVLFWQSRRKLSRSVSL
jgi:hypothetical protein